MGDILLRLLQPIRKNSVHIKWTLHASLGFSFLGNKLRESCIPIEHRYYSLSWAGLQVAPTNVLIDIEGEINIEIF